MPTEEDVRRSLRKLRTRNLYTILGAADVEGLRVLFGSEAEGILVEVGGLGELKELAQAELDERATAPTRPAVGPAEE